MNFRKFKRFFKRKKKRRSKKEKEKRLGIIPIGCNPCCCALVIIVLIGGMFAVGSGGNFIAEWFNIGTTTTITTTPTTTTTTAPGGMPHTTIPDDDIYYQLGLEFLIRNEDIDVLMVVMLYQFGGVGWIENINLAPIGLAVSSYDYKPGDSFFLDMFYGDAEYNISMTGVVNVEEAIYMTVYMNGVAIDEVVNVTWIAEGSGIRWDYP